MNRTPTPSSSQPPLSAAAEELLASLERSAGSANTAPGDPLRWLSALVDNHAQSIGTIGTPSQLEALQTAMTERGGGAGPARPLARAEVAAYAGNLAREDGRPIVSPQDMVSAVLTLVTERLAARSPSSTEAAEQATIPESVQDPATGSDPQEGKSPPASMATEEMLKGLCTYLGIGEGESAGVFRWLEVLLSHHEVGVDGEGGEGKLEGLKEWGKAREASGHPGPFLTSRKVRTAAARYARETGQPLVTPQDVAIAIVKLAMEAFTSARDTASAPPEPPKPSQETSETAPDTRSQGHQRTRTFRLFVSSTFADLQAERNVLQESTFDRLEKFCAKQGARFQAIDLRWGVSEEAGIDQQTMNICLGEIERCRQVTPRPNFLVLLGDRYGWIPPPAQVPADEFERILAQVESSADRKRLESWYLKDLNAEPPEYRLQPRSGQRRKYLPRETWYPEEEKIRGIFEAVLEKGHLDPPPRHLSLYRASATEQEVLAGALEADDPTDKVFCFFREIRHAPDSGNETLPETAQDFFSADPGERKQLRSLKDDLRKRLPEPCILERTVDWGTQGPDLSEKYLIELADWVTDSLKGAILQELEHPTTRPPSTIRLPEALKTEPVLTAEVAEHLGFAEERCRAFVGREGPLKRIADYIQGDTPTPLAILSGGGTGKSALMAEAVRRLGNTNPEAVPVVRFVGATPGSSDGRVLLESLCREISLHYGSDPGEVPNEYEELVPKLADQLGLATPEKPLVLLVDSLDQLAQPASGLTWIPNPLPPHVRLVVSSRPEEVGDRLESRGATFLELGPLARKDGEDLLQLWLASASPPRRLQPSQREFVLDAFVESEGNPLYLKLATEEARKWPSWGEMGGDPESDSAIKPLARGVREIINENLLARLAHDDNHGWKLVSRAISYLCASRYGLAEDELIKLLSRDPDVYSWFLQGAEHMPQDLVAKASKYWSPVPLEDHQENSPDQKVKATVSRLKDLREQPEGLRNFLTKEIGMGGLKLPVVFWSRLFSDLDPYLTERKAEGGNLLSFYHRELGDVAAGKFLVNASEEESSPPVVEDGSRGRIAEKEIHGRLADFFQSEADPEGERAWDGEGVRGLSELPYHLTKAERWDHLYETLTDFAFLEQKAARVGVVERTGPGGKMETLYTGVFQLQDDFDLALQDIPGGDEKAKGEHPLIVTAVDLGEGMAVRCPWCNTLHPLDQNWLGKEISCPNAECGGPLKVNSSPTGNPFEGKDSSEKQEPKEYSEETT